MKTYLHSFNTEAEMQEVLCKIDEYTSYSWQKHNKAYQYNPYDRVTDIYLVINTDEDKMTYWSKYQFNNVKIKEWNHMSAKDYLTDMKFKIWEYISVSFINWITKWKWYEILDIVKWNYVKWYIYRIINDCWEEAGVTESEAWESFIRPRTRFKVWDMIRYTNRVQWEVEQWKVIDILDWWLKLQSWSADYNKMNVTKQDELMKLELVPNTIDMSEQLFWTATADVTAWNLMTLTWDTWDMTWDTTTACSTIWSDSVSKTEVEEMIEEAVQLLSEETTEQILNSNNNTMETIEREANEIATEEYFESEKNIKAIRKADEELREISDTLNKAWEEIGKRYSKISTILSTLNRSYEIKDMTDVKEMLADIKAIKEYFKSFNATTVKTLGEEDEEESTAIDVKKVFN